MSKKPTKNSPRRTPASRRVKRPITRNDPAPTLAPALPASRTRPLARFRRATASPAQLRGGDLVRYLRIHLKHPYGDRGIKAIADLAREVAHLANLELNGRESK